MLAQQTSMWVQAQQLAPGWLTEDELARLNAMRQPARRQEFVACRYALRHLLAATDGRRAEHWRLDAPMGSTPHVNVRHHGLDVAASTYLSLSHSGPYLACAAATRPVGVDVEVRDVRAVKRDVLALAAMACTDEEMRQLQAIGCESSRHRLFLQWWSLKEAYFKCIGTGVDFSSIRRIECRPMVHGEGPMLAHARSWVGTTSVGFDVLLSVCFLEDGMQPYELKNDADIEWLGESDWSLIESPRIF